MFLRFSRAAPLAREGPLQGKPPSKRIAAALRRRASATKSVAQSVSMSRISSNYVSMMLFFLARALATGHFSAGDVRTNLMRVPFAATWTVLRPAKRSTRAMSNAGPSCTVDGHAAGTVGESFGCFLLEAPTTEGRRFLVLLGSCCCFSLAAGGF